MHFWTVKKTAAETSGAPLLASRQQSSLAFLADWCSLQ